MAKTYTYKLQGDGRDSWKCEDDETGLIYMVYEDPNKPSGALGAVMMASDVEKSQIVDLLINQIKQRLNL